MPRIVQSLTRCDVVLGSHAPVRARRAATPPLHYTGLGLLKQPLLLNTHHYHTYKLYILFKQLSLHIQTVIR